MSDRDIPTIETNELTKIFGQFLLNLTDKDITKRGCVNFIKEIENVLANKVVPPEDWDEALIKTYDEYKNHLNVNKLISYMVEAMEESKLTLDWKQKILKFFSDLLSLEYMAGTNLNPNNKFMEKRNRNWVDHINKDPNKPIVSLDPKENARIEINKLKWEKESDGYYLELKGIKDIKYFEFCLNKLGLKYTYVSTGDGAWNGMEIVEYLKIPTNNKHQTFDPIINLQGQELQR